MKLKLTAALIALTLIIFIPGQDSAAHHGPPHHFETAQSEGNSWTEVGRYDNEGVATGRSLLRMKAKGNAKKEARRIAGTRKIKIIDTDYKHKKGKWECTIRFVY